MPAKVAPDGQLTTNTIRDDATVRYRSFDGDYDNDVIVASKVNIPYLNRLPDLVALGMGIVAVVRDPLWTIASWNTEAAQRIPEYWVTQEHLHTRWADWQFESTDRIGRQSEVWARYATLILDEASAGAIHVLTYERMAQGDPILLDSVLPGRGLALDATGLVSMNHRGRYPGVPIEHIAETVSANRLHDIYSALAGFSI